jgi:TPP-dependent pyruvate/acetoin dehydrogenase alpha subunit
LRGRDCVAVGFLGDGAVNQGTFHEGLNLAVIWDLPVLLVCENNTYAEFSDSRTMSRRESVAAFAEASGCSAAIVDGNDVEAVQAAALEAVARCRSGDGPALIEALTYRWMGHYEGDPQTYKPAEEVAEWKLRDPLVVARRRIVAAGLVDDEALDAIESGARDQVDRAEAFARSSPYPELEEIWTDVYSD